MRAFPCRCDQKDTNARDSLVSDLVSKLRGVHCNFSEHLGLFGRSARIILCFESAWAFAALPSAARCGARQFRGSVPRTCKCAND